MTHLSLANKTQSPCDLALAGLGTAYAEGRYFVTALNLTHPNSADTLVQPGQQPKARLTRQVYACSADFPCDPFAHDMLSRSAAVADGNAFFGAYNPDAYKRAALGRTSTKDPTDFAMQYRAEAMGALKALDGLNIPPDLLVRAAFVGKSADRLCPADSKPTHQGAIETLAQLCVRLLCDQPSAAEANASLAAFQAAVERAYEQTRIPDSDAIIP